MAFNLSIQATSTIESGKYLRVSDVSDWTLADYLRDSYGIFLVGKYRITNTPEDISIKTYDPLTSNYWDANSENDGRYSFTAYAFLKRDVEAPSEGVVHVHTDGKLYQYQSSSWIEVELNDVLTEAAYTSTILEVPVLSHAYIFKAGLNLEYIKRVKADVEQGATQDEFYYSRLTLDYFRALIKAAEYNWSLNAYSNYYQIVGTLNAIITNGKIE